MKTLVATLCLLTCAGFAASTVLAAPPGKVFALSRHPDQLTGPADPAAAVPSISSVLAKTEVGDLRVTKALIGGGEYALLIQRMADGVPSHTWILARVATRDPEVEAKSLAVAEAFIEANNRGDAEAFLALFSPAARNFRNSGDPDRLGDQPSKSIVDTASRAAIYRKMFAAGQQAQVKGAAAIALGDLVVSHDLARLPNGKALDGLSVYRIAGGKITHDWYIYARTRE